MVKFIYGGGYPPGLFVNDIWSNAEAVCDSILRNSLCKKNFQSAAEGDFIEAAYDEGIGKTYTIKLTKSVDHLKSYANIVPSEPLTVNFNPLLALNIFSEFGATTGDSSSDRSVDGE